KGVPARLRIHAKKATPRPCLHSPEFGVRLGRPLGLRADAPVAARKSRKAAGAALRDGLPKGRGGDRPPGRLRGPRPLMAALTESSGILDMVNILLVDDQLSNLLALEAVLERRPYRLVRARSGEEALMRVLDDEFAVILMDVQMPGLDGFE